MKTTTSSIKNKIFMTELSYSPVTSKEVADFSKRDPANVTDYVLSGWPNNSNLIYIKKMNCQLKVIA